MAKYTLRQQISGLPWAQLLVVAIVRFSEPVAFASIYPYIYFMVRSFNIGDEHDVARYSGYLSSAYSLSQCLTGVFWGRMSDRYGRKPVIITGIVGTALSLMMFGLSSNFYMALVARMMVGIINGNTGVIRAMIGEIAPQPRHQALAFSIMPLMACVGQTIGPMLGGTLSDPVANHPEWFAPGSLAKRFFENHRFALPNLAVGALLFTTATFCFLFLDETQIDNRHKPDFGRRIGKALARLVGGENHQSSEEVEPLIETAEEEEAAAHEPSRVSLTQIMTPTIWKMLFANAFIASHSVVYDEFLPVFMSTPVGAGSSLPLSFLGGLGLKSATIGQLLSVNGIVGIIVMVVLFPWAERTFGPVATFHWSTFGFPVAYFLIPFMVFLVNTPVLQGALLSTMFIRTFVNSLAPPTILILVNRAVKNRRHLGVVNGTVQMASAFARAMGPFVWGYFMALGQRLGLAELAWWLLALFAFVSWVESLLVTEAEIEVEASKVVV